VEVLNFYLVILLLSPWIIGLWERATFLVRAAIVPLVYAAGVFLSELPVHPLLLGLKNIIAAYPASEVHGIPPDTFPVLQLSSLYLLGYSFGGYVFVNRRGLRKPSAVGAGYLMGAACLLAAYLLSGESVEGFIKDLSLDRYRFPPGLPYILFGFSGVLLVTSLCFSVYEIRNYRALLTRILELLGRHSLFTFVVQYVLLFTIYGLMLNLWFTQGLLGSAFQVLIIVTTCVLLAWAWETLRRRWNRLHVLRSRPGCNS
jgi:hypothetical protein